MDALEHLYTLRVVRVLNCGLGSVSGKSWNFYVKKIKLRFPEIKDIFSPPSPPTILNNKCTEMYFNLQ